MNERATFYYESTVDDGVPGLIWPASEPSLDQIIEHARMCWPIEFPHRDVGNRTDRDLAEFAFSSETSSATSCGDLECCSCRHCGSPRRQLALQHREPSFLPKRRAVR